MVSQIFFDGWDGIIRTLVIGVVAYVGLLATLRGFGKRTIAKMNIYDFVVTIALGSALATVLLSSDVVVAEGMAAFLVLSGLQYLLSRMLLGSPRLERWINGEPTLVVHRGEFLRAAMRGERITEEEVRAAIRSKGLADMTEVEALVLETDGSWSVVQSAASGPASSLYDVPEYPQRADGSAK